VYLRVSPTKKGYKDLEWKGNWLQDTLVLMRLRKVVDQFLIAFAYPSSLLLSTTCSTCPN
jgi:hypothetical protein